jgi:uncharacterized protein
VSVVGVSVRGMAVFAVAVVHGPAWDPAVGRREQDGWDEHAAFMDGLVADGRVILGGPVGDGTDVLLAVEATDEDALRAAFATDPWLADGTLALGRIQPWQLWLDSRTGPVAAGPV